MSPDEEVGEAAASLAEDGPAVGEGVGGTITGVAGVIMRGVRVPFPDRAGEEKSRGFGAGLVSTPSEFTSTPSASFTVPSARNACSKSMSVRDMRRSLFDAPGCSPPGNDDGGNGERDVATFRNKARMGNAVAE
jgi:hypothetical protein